MGGRRETCTGLGTCEGRPGTMLTRMKNIHQYLRLTLCFLLTAAVGYYYQALRDKPPSDQAGEIIGLDYFMPVQSFSEVETVRARMHALAARSLLELRHRRLATGRPDRVVEGQELRRQQEVVRLIKDFHSAIHEFGGTGYELLFVQDLLWLLKNEQRHEEWIGVYLHALYRHPIHPMIGRLAPEAVRMGQVASREQEVMEAIELLQGIPTEFTGNRPASLDPSSDLREGFEIVLHQERTHGSK
jgi:hypothetical protein